MKLKVRKPVVPTPYDETYDKEIHSDKWVIVTYRESSIQNQEIILYEDYPTPFASEKAAQEQASEFQKAKECGGFLAFPRGKVVSAKEFKYFIPMPLKG